MEHAAITSFEPFPALDSAPTTPEHDHDAPVIPEIPSQASAADAIFQVEYEGPLYTEINIPLPRIPTHYNASQPSATTTASASTSAAVAAVAAVADKTRSRSLTLSSLSPFRHRRSSSSATSPLQSPPTSASPKSTSTTTRHSEEWPRIRKDVVKSREVNAMMDLRHQSKKGRSGTIDALAVVPAVLVLSAELFTPGVGGREGKRKDSGVGRWEDGIR